MEGINKTVRPEVGTAPMAPRKEGVTTNAEKSTSPETIAEIDAAEAELKAQLSLLESKRSQLESLDVAALQNNDSPELSEKVQRTFTEIQEAYDKSVFKIKTLIALSTSAGLGSILITNIVDSYYKSQAELLTGINDKMSETALQITAGATIGIYAAAAVGGVALLINKWKKGREDKARHSAQ